MLKQNPDKVKVVFKNFPLSRHRYASQAAQAAMAAARQGKFWEFHDKLFENYRKLNDEKINEIAVSLGLDLKKLHKEMESPEVLEKVKTDKENGEAIGVSGTPSIFVNGFALRDRSPRGFQEAIDQALKRIQ